jgi:hypothetical protein
MTTFSVGAVPKTTPPPHTRECSIHSRPKYDSTRLNALTIKCRSSAKPPSEATRGGFHPRSKSFRPLRSGPPRPRDYTRPGIDIVRRWRDDVLEAEIAAAEKRMLDDLEGIRARFTNPGIKGSGAEETLRSFLRKYLPRRLELGHGEVVDSFGNRSKQTDVVIATKDHPFTFTTESPGLFFVEGVAAGGEVKTVLTSVELSSAIENARAFKRMRQKVPKGLDR